MPLQYLPTPTRRRPNQQRHKKRGPPWSKRKIILATSVIAIMSATKHQNTCMFDTDSVTIGIDNRASGCISYEPTDFIGPLRECNRVIKGYNGAVTTNIKTGTLQWKWSDD